MWYDKYRSLKLEYFQSDTLFNNNRKLGFVSEP